MSRPWNQVFVNIGVGLDMETKNQKTEQTKILLVDDNEQVRTTLSIVLEMSQFRVTAAANVGEALHLIDAEPFDALLCD